MFGLEFGWEIGVALLAVLVLMAMPHVSRKMHGPVDYIQPHELNRMLTSGEPLTLLDIRSQKEYSNDHIAQAVHMPRENMDDYFAQRDQQDTGPVVLVCQSDLDSARLAGRFRKSGIDNIKVMQGGMFRWKQSRLPVERDQ